MSTSHALLRCCCSILWMFVQDRLLSNTVAVDRCASGSMLSFEVTHVDLMLQVVQVFGHQMSITESTDDQSLDVFVFSATSCSKHVVSEDSVVHFACFKPRSFFWRCSGSLRTCAHHASGFQIIFHPPFCGTGRRKKNTLLVWC